MHPDVRHAERRCQLDDRHEMAIVGVDAAGADQADQVSRPPRLRGRGGRRRAVPDEWRSCRRRSPRRSAAGPGELAGRPPGSGGRPPSCPSAPAAADRVLRRPERGVRPVAQEAAPDGHPGRGDRVGRGVAADPEPVEDDQDDGSRPGAPAMTRRHPVSPRAAAVTPARATIPAISSGLSDAPPTRAPSIDGSARNSPIAAEVTLPP